MRAYFKARSYLPGIGVFAQTDPIDITEKRLTDPLQLNPYLYARLNPLLLTDPTGKDIWQYVDFFKGEINAVAHDATWGWIPVRQPQTSEEAGGQVAGHIIAAFGSASEISSGGGLAFGGLYATPETGGLSLGVSGVGALTAIHGVGVGTTAAESIGSAVSNMLFSLNSGNSKSGSKNLNSNDAISDFGVYEIKVNGDLHKVGKADLNRITLSSKLPTRLHQQLRKLEKIFGIGSVTGNVVEKLYSVTSRIAKAAEKARLQRIFDETNQVPPGNQKSFKPV